VTPPSPTPRPKLRQSESPQARFSLALALSIGALAVFLRAYFYAVDRSLWLDEAMLATNIVHRSLRGLMLPLEYHQGAPLGFLFLVKAISDVLGTRDLVLRLVPFVSALAAVPLMWLVAQEFVTGIGPLAALALLAVNDRLIYYASEFKQYSTDALVTLALLALFLKCLGKERRAAAFVAFGLGGALAFWLSHPSLFVAGGLALALGLALAAERDWRALGWLAAAGLVWAADLALLYVVSLRQLEADASLLSYWAGAYPPWPPWLHGDWYAGALAAALNNPLGLPASALSAGLLLVGGASLARRRWPLLAAALAPLLLALAASSLQKYPFAERLLLFAVPLALLVLAEAVERLYQLARRLSAPAGWLAAAALGAYLIGPPALLAGRLLKTPPRGEDIKPVMAYLDQQRRPGDAIYVYYGALPAFEYYAPFYGIGRGQFVPGNDNETDPNQYQIDLGGLAGQPRVWIVFSHICPNCAVNEEAEYVADLDQMGVRLAEARAEAASAYLYDLRPPASQSH